MGIFPRGSVIGCLKIGKRLSAALVVLYMTVLLEKFCKPVHVHLV